MPNSRVLQEQLEVLAGTRRQGNQGQAAVRKSDYDQGLAKKTDNTTFTAYQTTVDASLAQAAQDLVDAQTALQDNIDALDDAKSNKTRTINAYAATTHTLVLGDAANIVQMAHASAKTLTVPANATVDFDDGTQIDLLTTGGGTMLVAPAGGVTVNSAGSRYTLKNNGLGSLIYLGSDVWVLDGNLVT
jgi:hypothetical protein